MPSSCNNEKDTESTFMNFARTLLKSFVLLTIVIMIVTLKNRMLTEDTTLFYTVLFIMGSTALITLVGVVDSYVYSNVILGIGLALGLQLMDVKLK